MKVEVYVAGVVADVWFRGTRDERQVLVMNCLERTAFLGLKMKDTFDYVPTKEEVEELDIAALDGANVTLAVTGMKAGGGGRMKFQGRLDRSSLPAGTVKSNGGTAPSSAAQKIPAKAAH